VTRGAHERVLLEAAFVLHQHPYRDSSRILELLTRHHGRRTVFSRGTHRPGSPLTAVLQPFSRVLVSWSARGEAGTLIHAEFDGAPTSLHASRLMSGFYLNELLIRLLPRHDPQTDVFDLYAATLEALRSQRDEGVVLRVFEKRLLEIAGYGLSLTHDVRSGVPVDATRTYRFLPDEGPVEWAPGVAEGHFLVTGATLLALAAESLDEPTVRHEARRILRMSLDRCLEGRGLRSRDVMTAMRRAAPASSSAAGTTSAAEPDAAGS